MYKNARKSKIENLGKDIEGSARHLRGGKKEKEDLKNNPSECAKKSLLLKNFPPVYKVKDIHSAKLHLILRKYPAKLSKSYIDDVESASSDYIDFYFEVKDFLLNYEDKLRDCFCQESEVKDLIYILKNKIKDKIRELRKINQKSTFANTLIDFHNNSLSNHKKRSVLKEIKKLTDQESVILNIIDKNKGIDAALGIQKEKKNYFSRKEAYGKSIERKGKDISQDYSEFLIKKAGVLALQWGNYVSDKERSLHIKLISESFYDLSEALEMPLKSITRGKLSVAVGARGRGDALAHYEDHSSCINLTKKNGFGSLAHEIGHFFDSEFTSKFKASSKYITSTNHSFYKNTEHEEILMKWYKLKNKIINRICSDNLLFIVSPSKRRYWLSGHEVFARCFERYVKLKLTKKEIINDYLVKEIDHPLWCNNDELLEFEEIADYIVNELKEFV